MRRVLAATALVVLAGCTSSTSGSGSGGSTTSTPVSTPSATASPIPASSTPPSPPSSSAPATSLAPVPHSGPLNGFLVADVTFVGHLGWALGTVGCTEKSGRCTAIAHSTDNGRTWRSIRPPEVNVAVPGFQSGNCAKPCERYIRFATPAIGYLFGGENGPLFVTADGGNTWNSVVFPHADQLETLDGNVIAVYDEGGCPPGCRLDVVTGRLGVIQNPSGWRAARLPGNHPVDGVLLARTGSHAYLLGLGHPAGGAQNARSTLWTSADDGRHWTNRGEPCPQSTREVDSTNMTSAPDGSVTVLCRARSGSGRQFTATSTDGGAHFRAGSRTALGGADISALGAARARTILVSSDDTYRSTDGGRHFRRLSAESGSSPGVLGWLGFASPTVAHAISVDRRTIWTSTDGGVTWRAGALR